MLSVLLIPFSVAIGLASVALQKVPAFVARKKAAIDSAINVLSNVAEIDKEDLVKDIEQFSDMDFFFIVKASQALGSEVLCFRARTGISSKDLADQQPGYRRPLNANTPVMDCIDV
mmetsp:Transcript_67125/g.151712  ORF Transcript_67125/g.151712 Transcript_67125/m.151712 type:complete len:116 (-) Transcript_67125:185-532(-)